MDAAEELAAKLKARANLSDAAWWGHLEEDDIDLLGVGRIVRGERYEGVLAGRNAISAEIEYLLSRNAKRILDAETAEPNGAQKIYDALVADFRRFILTTAYPHAVKEQRDLIEAGDFVEAEA